MPEVSVVIPVFKAAATLRRAVESISAQGYSPRQVEIILAPDDRGDYAWLKPAWPGLRILPSRYFRTGPGAARNRAIAQARGRFLAFLDADDAWGEGYLDAMLPLARRHHVVFAPTRVVSAHGQVLMTMATGQGSFRLGDFGIWPGSFHPLVAATLSPGFRAGPGQDVFHAMEVLGRLGKAAPMAGEVAYHLYLGPESVTADPAFGWRVNRQYQQMIRLIRAGATTISGFPACRAIAALEARRRWNRRWNSSAGHRDGFYGYVAAVKNNFS